MQSYKNSVRVLLKKIVIYHINRRYNGKPEGVKVTSIFYDGSVLFFRVTALVATYANNIELEISGRVFDSGYMVFDNWIEV